MRQRDYSIKILIILMMATLFVSGCATAPINRPSTAMSTGTSLKLLCDRNNVSWQWDSITQVVVLSKNQQQAKALVGSNIVLLDGKEIRLSRPILRENGLITVPSDFKRSIIDKFHVQPQKVFTKPLAQVKTVVVDAGHGGKDPGAISRKGTMEKYVVLDIAKHLQRILKREGIKVKMTRHDDTFISLAKRTEIASQSSADLFVSVHANSHPRRGIHGLEVYTLKELTYADKKEEQRIKNQRLLSKSLDMKSGDRDLNNIVADMLYIHKQSESLKLAKLMAKEMSKSIKTKNLGQKHSRFFVLRNTLIPAVLVEVGFLSNPKEEKLLKTKSYRKKVAEALAKSILDYVEK